MNEVHAVWCPMVGFYEDNEKLLTSWITTICPGNIPFINENCMSFVLSGCINFMVHILELSSTHFKAN
jgi:hypothetical protein